MCSRHYTRFIRYGSASITHRAAPGAGTIDVFGYRLVTVRGRRIREHRVVMENVMGRPLLPTEIVHHIDGNKLNNVPANLALTTRALHPKEHATFRSETHKECSLCHVVTPRAAFHRNALADPANQRDPHGSRCRECDLREQNRRARRA